MTIRKAETFSSASRRNKMLVSCLDCGKEFSYNWEEMRIDAAEPLVGFRTQRLAAFGLGRVVLLSPTRPLILTVSFPSSTCPPS